MMTDLETEDKKLRDMCPEVGWCEKLQRFFSPRKLEILHNKCFRCPNRKIFIRNWLSSAKLPIPDVYKDNIGDIIASAALKKLNKPTTLTMTGKEEMVKPCGGCPKAKMLANQPPSLIEKAINVTKSGVKYVQSGFKKTTKTEYDERIKTCLNCEEHYYDQFGKLRCGICQCFLRVKARMLCEECPIGKWVKNEACKE